jgi:hypothetical protein
VTAKFYSDLPTSESFASAFESRACRPLPDDWTVLVATVRCIEAAVEQGRYRDVNAVAVASIAAIRNGFPGQDYPVIFCGDGVTLCLPENALENARALLLDCQQLARREFDLDLRIGAVPVSLLRELGTDVRVGRVSSATGQPQAWVTGDGLSTAEDLVKSSHQFLIQRSRSSLKANFAGFQCRLDEVPSPSEETISLLVRAVDGSELEQTLTYTHVLQLIGSIYGSENAHHPVRATGVRMRLSPGWLRNEARVCNPGYNRLGKAMHLLSVLPQFAGIADARSVDGANGSCEAAVRRQSHWRGFDDQLRMVIAGTVEHRARLRARLTELHHSGRVAFGIHVSNSSLITSIVCAQTGETLHFIDGTSGGYALAAVEMKAQLRVLESQQQRTDIAIGESLAAELRRQSAHFRKDRREISDRQSDERLLDELGLATKENRQKRVGLSPL